VVAVYDFGGGTFDAAVLRKTGDRFDLLGEAEGLERLGGVDFDQAILGLVNAATGRALDALDQDDPTARAAANRLRDECRQTKEALSSDTEGVIPVLLTALQTEVRLTREEFEEMVRRGEETIATLSGASGAGSFDQVDSILIVGGSSRIPLWARLCERRRAGPGIDAHPKHAMPWGRQSTQLEAGERTRRGGTPSSLMRTERTSCERVVRLSESSPPGRRCWPGHRLHWKRLPGTARLGMAQETVSLIAG